MANAAPAWLWSARNISATRPNIARSRRRTGAVSCLMSAERLDRAARADAPSPASLGPPRDFKGYGRNPPDPKWPGGARIAVNINLNVEAGGEHCLLEGDDRSEDALNDIGLPAYQGARSPAVKSIFEYGPRSGCWRLMRIFKRFDVKISILGVVRALGAMSGTDASLRRRRP